ncbi:hypothetical protein V7S43_016829 [Phytophthora oleae]|uniref:Uncharacterized protein n=1 Tax=Phytophthora oleae TaxID=2107226 RepID=A0ABD3EVL5_9STRA
MRLIATLLCMDSSYFSSWLFSVNDCLLLHPQLKTLALERHSMSFLVTLVSMQKLMGKQFPHSLGINDRYRYLHTELGHSGILKYFRVITLSAQQQRLLLRLILIPLSTFPSRKSLPQQSPLAVARASPPKRLLERCLLSSGQEVGG